MSGFYVLVEPEKVCGIVFSLYLDEPIIVRAESGPDKSLNVPLFMTKEVQITGAGRIWEETVPGFPDPCDVPGSLSCIPPASHEVRDEAGVADWIGCFIRSHAAHRASDMHHEDHCRVRAAILGTARKYLDGLIPEILEK